MKITIFATGHPDIRPSGGRERRVWEIAQYLGRKHHIFFVYPNFNRIITGMHHLDILLHKIKFLFATLPKDSDVWYCSRAPLAVIWTRAKVIADCGRLWIWHWSPITLIDNFSNLLGYFFSDIKIFNAKKNCASNGIVINPGIDLKRFRPRKTKKIYDCLYAGRTEKAKGFNDFIKLAKLLPGKKFCIAGSAKGPFPKNVTCLGHCADMPEIYNKCRFLIQTSHGESYSQTVLEALACGLHVISYDTIATEFFDYCKIVKKGNYRSMTMIICQNYAAKNKVPKEWLKQFDKDTYLKKIGNVIDGIDKDRMR